MAQGDAFNLGLCERFGLLPLEFDGQLGLHLPPLRPLGAAPARYLRERGSFRDLPLAQIYGRLPRVYPRWLHGLDTRSALEQGDFLADVAREPGAG